MESLFANPWAMIAGGLLVSAPIIIHLINRMRFKRIQWAAMEFLLKAQKRMRRKMIIEQLILLLLRILLVLLVGLLVSKYLGFAGANTQTRPTRHLVLLDDSPSMGDFWRGEDGQITDPFIVARKQLAEQIVPAASQATTPQLLDVMRLSDLNEGKEFDRINAETASKVDSYFASITVSKVRGSLAEGLRQARTRFDRESLSDVSRVLHVMSDFRAIDWLQEGEAIKEAIRELNTGQVRVHLIDTAHPFRRNDKKSPLFHDNVGIIELKPKARVVALNEPVEFTVKVRNFGNTELRDVMVKFLLNGQPDIITSRKFDLLSANEEKEQSFTVEFNKTGTDQKPLDRFSLVTARLELTEPAGLAVDNVRHAVVEVRDRLEILVVEGTDPALRDKKEADGFYLKRVFLGSIGGLNWVNGTMRDLETRDLRRFSAVYLLNLPEVTEAAAKNLEGYVREGGGVGIFLGPRARPDAYNKLLYKDGDGLMPVPLPAKATDEPKDRDVLRAFTQKILRRDPSSRDHPIVRSLYRDSLGNPVDPREVEKFFHFVDVKQYWPVKRLGRWREDPAVKEIYCLPSEMPMGEAQTIVEPMIRKLKEKIKEPKYAPYRQYLDQSRPVEAGQSAAKPLLDEIQSLMTRSDPVALLANELDRLLADQGATGDPSVPILREFWSLSEMADLRSEFVRIRDTVKFGDPLYLAKQLGTGRVATLLTTSGETWNDWASGWGKASFAPVMGELQKYLAGGGSDDNLALGDSLHLTFDPTRFESDVVRTRLSLDESKKEKTVVAKELGTQTMRADQDRLALAFSEATEPGAYVFELARLKDPAAPPNAASPSKDYVAYAFNIDVIREGDLRRANTDDVSQLSEKSPMHSPDDINWTDDLKQKPRDLSSGHWLFLFLILVLAAEQMMAVRLSHHTHPGELEEFSPTAADALKHGIPTEEVVH